MLAFTSAHTQHMIFRSASAISFPDAQPHSPKSPSLSLLQVDLRYCTLQGTPRILNMPRNRLPGELGLSVISALGDELDISMDYWDAHMSTLWDLCSCALVCRDWLSLSRIHIFRAIYVRHRKGLDSLRDAFSRHSELQRCVKVLHIESNKESNVAILSLLPRLPNLCALGLWSDGVVRLSHRTISALKLFTNITTLYTDYQSFISEASFLRVVSAIPSLSALLLKKGFMELDEGRSCSLKATYSNTLRRRSSVRSVQVS